MQKLGLAESEGKGKPKPLRLYCLKKGFKKFMNADEDYKKFWMGRSETSTHYISMDPEYHRRLYAEGYENLRLYKPTFDAEAIAKLTRENLKLKERIKQLEAKYTLAEEDVKTVKKFLENQGKILL